MTIVIIRNCEAEVMGTRERTVAEAKAKLSELIERAQSDARQTITRKG